MQKYNTPAQTVDMVPRLKQSSLLSESNITDANYTMLFTTTEENIFDGETTTIIHSKEPILQRWRDPKTSCNTNNTTKCLASYNHTTTITKNQNGNNIVQSNQGSVLCKLANANSTTSHETLSRIRQITKRAHAIRISLAL